MNERALGETAQPETLEQTNTAPAQSGGLAGPTQCRLRMKALKRAARKAPGASAAYLRKRPDDAVANMDLRHIGTDRGHDSGNFVAEDRRRRRDVMRGEEQVRMTQA